MSGTDVPLADTRDMYMVHATFRREFGLLPSLVRAVPAGALGRAKIVADHFELLTTILTHHHHAEDVHLWPRLLDRAAHEAASVVETMESQHAMIEKLDAESVAAVGAWCATGSEASAENAAEVLDELVAALRTHMAAEETYALPLAEKYITAAEWGDMVQSTAAGIDPELMPLLLGLMMYEGDPELIDEILAGMPPEIGPMLKPLAAQAFTAHAELVYGTATPPRGTV